eukprot:TRINITY_DN1367_c5_g1_i2.p1 TRINITY_DN1367_c5_g1~~TRINITY_DN1367_c5_g1_i2.p1  ORF type:complete len:412 (+),score=41.33 TRINITY_DN1367_c5_g1_i2:420-1655(+)
MDKHTLETSINSNGSFSGDSVTQRSPIRKAHVPVNPAVQAAVEQQRQSDPMAAKIALGPCLVNIGYLSLLVLVIQNSSLVLLTRYTTAHQEVVPSTGQLIVMVEIVKMIICVTWTYIEQGHLNFREFSAIISSPETIKLAVPAGLFTLQNYLIFVSLANLDVMTFQVLSQVKLLLAAVFSVLMLDKFLNLVQWLSIFLLMGGIALASVGKQETEKQIAAVNPTLGTAACLISGTSSSFAGVYFEKVLKNTTPSIAVRNIQIGTSAIFFSATATTIMETTRGSPVSFMQGMSVWTVLLILNHAFGGVLVAIVVKYADNIMKGFASGVAMVLTGVFSIIVWGFTPTPHFTAGCAIVCVGSVTYHLKYDTKLCRKIARMFPGGSRIPATPALVVPLQRKSREDGFELEHPREYT